MRFALSAVSALSIVLGLATASAFASESGEFVEWALQQGKACDSSWESFVNAQPDGVTVDHSVSRGRAARSFGQARTGLTAQSKGFIHKANLPFLPFAARRRSDPSRGFSTLRSPASARLNVPHSRRRPLRSNMELGRSRRRRWGGSTRLSAKSSRRISRTSRRRRSASRTGYGGGKRGW